MAPFFYKKLRVGRYFKCGAFAYRLNQGKEVKEDAKMRAFMRDIQEIISEIIHQYHPSNPDLASNDMSVELEIESINSIKLKINRNGKIPPTDSRKSERSERKEG